MTSSTERQELSPIRGKIFSLCFIYIFLKLSLCQIVCIFFNGQVVRVKNTR